MQVLVGMAAAALSSQVWSLCLVSVSFVYKVADFEVGSCIEPPERRVGRGLYR